MRGSRYRRGTVLRSVQEARILLEHAEESREVLEGLPGTLVDGFLEALRKRLLPHAASYAQLAVDESDYGNAEDEQALIEWVLTELLDDVYAQMPTQELYSRSTTHSVESQKQADRHWGCRCRPRRLQGPRRALPPRSSHAYRRAPA